MKLTDKQFWDIYKANGGICNRTAKAIEKTYGCKYSAMAVYDRANRYPEKKKEVQEANCDVAEEVIMSALRSPDEKTRIDVAKFYLKTKGKHRGYTERSEITGKDGTPIEIEPIVGINIVE